MIQMDKKGTKLTLRTSRGILHLLQEWLSAAQGLSSSQLMNLQVFFCLHLQPGLQTMPPCSYLERRPGH